MSKLLLIIGICQIVAGAVIIGLVGKNYHDTVNTLFGASNYQKVRAFGPVLIGILIVFNGIVGVLTMCCKDNKKMGVFYLIGATVAASAAAAMLWIYALEYSQCDRFRVFCPESNSKDIYLTLVVFSAISCGMSVFGMISSALSTCRML